jgi:hypothetical protein
VTQDSRRPVDDLEALAQARFPSLSQAELKLLRAAPKGEVAWCGPSAKYDDPANDPARADEWGPEREVRADLIRWLCVDRDAASAVDPMGIQIHAARISGALNLSFVSVPFPLCLWRCRFTDHADLISTDLPELNLAGSRVESVTADGAVVKGGVFLRDGFSAEGEVRLLGARIGGSLDCSGGAFKNPGKDALSADGADVKGSVFLRAGFRAGGAVRLLGAQIGGDLDCSDGTFKNPGGGALRADGAGVEGAVFLREGFNAKGEVGLPGVQIGGQLDCSGGTFKNPGHEALSADGANVKGGIFLNKRFSAEGGVRLLGAQIGGNLTCSGGTFENPGGDALTADGAKIEGAVFLSDGISAEGEVRLLGAKIGGYLECKGGTFSGMNAESAAIVGPMSWRGVKAAERTTLDLANASAGSLVDEEKSWPGRGRLFLDGFVYGHISGESSPRDAKTRLKWLERQEPFTPKPYRQLAKVLREAGDESGARKVLFEMERRRRQVEDRSWYARRWGWLLKWTIGYGFYSWWALGWLVLLTALGWGLFRHGYFSGAMAPTDKDAYCFYHRHQGRPPDYYQRFTASVYSLENSLPFVNLGQKDYWMPDPNPQASRRMPRIPRWVPWGQALFRGMPSILRCFRWGQVLLGWLLATLFVAGVTGVVRKE